MELGSLNFQAKLAKLFGTCAQKNARKRMLPCFPLYSEVPQFRFLPSVRDLGFKSYTQKDLRTDFFSIGACWLLPCFFCCFFFEVRPLKVACVEYFSLICIINMHWVRKQNWNKSRHQQGLLLWSAHIDHMCLQDIQLLQGLPNLILRANK